MPDLPPNLPPGGQESGSGVTRRGFLHMLGAVGGVTLAYHAMTSMGLAQGSTTNPLPDLQGRGDGTTVLILGAGLAGMCAAFELAKLGYSVRVLEFQDRAGGRCWTLRGGDTYTEMGGYTQRVGFSEGQYFNPGPWRIPYHHTAVLDYCRLLGVPLEPFIQTNYNAYIHRREANPQRLRLREAITDFQGGVAELLAKSVNQGALDQELSTEDREGLLGALRTWGILNSSDRYVTGLGTSDQRGYRVDPADRLVEGEPSEVQPLSFILDHGFWEDAYTGLGYSYQNTIFQPVGGMDRIAAGFARQVGRLITYGAQVTALTVTDDGATVTYTDRQSGQAQQLQADYCVCTLPLSVMSQMTVQVNRELEAAIRRVPYGPSFKAGLEAPRFWERDERIYGGVTYTDLPIQMISYPSYGMNAQNRGVLLAAYQFGAWATRYSAYEPEERLARVRRDVEAIHPQAAGQLGAGVSVGWHRVPWVLGCFGLYTDEGRDTVYETVSARHGRLLLAGEHVSYWPGWMEGALLSAISAVRDLHATAQGPGPGSVQTPVPVRPAPSAGGG